jgi:mannose-6-phosphate isomerase
MIAAEQLYPYRLEPLEKSLIWGGGALVARYGKAGSPTDTLGESWECWDANRVENGSLAGTTLADLRRELGADLMGSIDAGRIFPVLTKIIDARAPLSVQVHPDDAYAQRVEHQPNGKTECWYILAAEPGAELVLGWTRDTDRAEYERRVADGTLGELLRRVPVTAGQTYYLPAGTLHAIGAGIELFEAQQASDLTYRIFDWNRVGADGQPRELHVAKAGDVLDFRATLRGATSTVSWHAEALERTLLVADRRFVFERVRTTGAGRVTTDGQPITVTALGTPLRIALASAEIDVPAYGTIVVPAALASFAIAAPAEMLVVRPEPALDRLREAARVGGVAAAELDRFFGQFA